MSQKIIQNIKNEENNLVTLDNDNNQDIRIARINTTKKRLQNILQNKIKSTIDIEPSKIQKELIPKMLKKVIILLIIKIK